MMDKIFNQKKNQEDLIFNSGKNSPKNLTREKGKITGRSITKDDTTPAGKRETPAKTSEKIKAIPINKTIETKSTSTFASKSKIFKYKVSLAYTIIPTLLNAKNNPWFQSIIEDKLFLGAIPLKEHLDPIKKQGIKAVLTTLEEFEINTKTFYSKPLTSKDWKENNIDHLFIETPDFKPVPINKIEEGVEWLYKKIIKEKEPAIAHCKAGRGRSATVVIAHLLKYGTEYGLPEFSVKEAIAFVKSKRPAINMNSKQREALNKYYEVYVKPQRK